MKGDLTFEDSPPRNRGPGTEGGKAGDRVGTSSGLNRLEKSLDLNKEVNP